MDYIVSRVSISVTLNASVLGLYFKNRAMFHFTMLSDGLGGAEHCAEKRRWSGKKRG